MENKKRREKKTRGGFYHNREEAPYFICSKTVLKSKVIQNTRKAQKGGVRAALHYTISERESLPRVFPSTILVVAAIRPFPSKDDRSRGRIRKQLTEI